MRGLGFAILCDVFMFFGLAEMVGVFYYGSRLPIVLFCRVALLGFAILCDNVATMCEGENQREQDKGLAAPNPVP